LHKTLSIHNDDGTVLKQIAADGQITGYDIFGRQTRVMSRGAGIAAEIISAKYDYHMPF